MAKFIFILLALVVSGTATPAFARAGLDVTCKAVADDPLDIGLRITNGSFAGRCQDLTTRRPPVLIAGEPLHFANFFHADKWWHARVPANSVEHVYFQVVPFDSGVPAILAAHTQLRFLFAGGAKILLESQRTGENESLAADDLIVSSTYTGPTGETYSALKGLGGSYGIVARVLSSVARAKEEILTDQSTVRQFELRLTADERNQLLVVALQRAAEAAYSEDYELLKQNCTTLTFDTIDALRPRPQGVGPMRGRWWLIHDEFIRPSLAALSERHLIDDKSEVQTMNEEIVCSATEDKCVHK